MSISADIQQLEVGSIVTLFVVDGTAIGADKFLFHPYGQGQILFQGQAYDPWKMTASGFERSGSSNAAPKLRMENVGGFVGALCEAYDDMRGAKVIRKQTLAKYLDGQPTADPDEEFPPEIWFVEQKTAENPEYVEFELSSAMSFEGVQLPRRQIIQNYCPWRYRGADCGYLGGPVADEWDIITTDASKDKCGKRIQSCLLRFQQYDPNPELPFGGFAAAGLTR